MKKKTIALLLVMMMVFGITVGGTIAYLTDTKTVTNTFTVGNVTITLDEAKVDAYGVEVEGADRVTGNEYKLIPGHTYVKDPTIHVGATSEDCWLFVKVENGLDTNATFTWSEGWTQIEGTNYWQYKDAVSKDANIQTFTKFTVNGDAEVADLGEKQIVVTAYAVQKDGLSQTEAWDQIKPAA